MTADPTSPAALLLAEPVWGSALHAIRSIGVSGAAVHVALAGSSATPLRQSRWCTSARELDDSDLAEFCARAADFADAACPGSSEIVVLPLTDRLLAALHEHREAFGPRFRLALPSPELVEPLLDKSRSLALAKAAGLHVPPWTNVNEAASFEPDELTFPVAVRPTSWSTIGSEYFKIAVLDDPRELNEFVAAAISRGASLIVQQFIEAREQDVEFALLWRNRAGDRTDVVTGRKCRQSERQGGVMVWGITEELPDVRSAALAFLDSTGYRGLGGIEFIRQGGRLHFIEFNPRIEAIHFLAHAAGVDSVRHEFEDLARRRHTRIEAPQRAAAGWVGSACFQRWRSDPAARSELLRDRLRFARQHNRARAVWRWDDPLPGIAVIGAMMRQRWTRRSGAATQPS